MIVFAIVNSNLVRTRILWEQWYFRGDFLKIFADQSRSVKGDLRNTINVVGNLVTRVKAFSGELKKIAYLA